MARTFTIVSNVDAKERCIMDKPKVYLAGIISGLDYKSATTWREYAQQELDKAGIIGASPMRAKKHLNPEDKLDEMGYDKNPMSTQEGITTRDRWDVMTCDVVLMNLLGAEKRSIGCSIEVGWADAWRKPIILVAEEGNVHEHAMLLQCCAYRVNTVDEAIDIAKKILVY